MMMNEVIDILDRFELFIILAIIAAIIVFKKRIISWVHGELEIGQLTKHQLEIKQSLELLANQTQDLSEAQIIVLRDRLIQAHDFFIKKGSIDWNTFDNLDKMLAKYESRGENGAVKTLMKELEKLPKT